MSSHAVTLPDLKVEGLSEQSAKLCRFAAEKSIGIERAVEEILCDMRLFKFSVSTLRKIALGGFNENEKLDPSEMHPGNSPARYWSYTETGRRAAAKLLAEADQWSLEVAAEHAKTGYQRFLKCDPLLRSIATSYEGGPIEGLAEHTFDFAGLGNTINEMTIGDFRKISLAFLEMILPDSEFAQESEIVATVSRWKLSERKDLLSKGMNQLDKKRRVLLKKIMKITDQENREGSPHKMPKG